MSDRTLRAVPGYGASLRSQLAAIGWTQSRLSSESGVSRQTISRAINHDEISERTERTLAAALRRAPAERRVWTRDGTRSPTPILGKALCDASDLVAWAGRRESQSLLPLVIQRLIRATATRVTEFHIRTGEGVHLPGWDGIVRNEQDTPFVPEGTSGWEMSVAVGPQGKADKDYRKRSEDSKPLVPEDTTLVFVTLRRWGGKDVWAAEKTEEGPWRRVKALDADDVAAWLEEAPAVHTWLSIQIGKIPPGTNDLEAYWDEWSGATRPALTPAIVLSGRDGAVADMHRRLSDVSGQAFAIRAESRDEAIGWMYCVIQDFPPERADSILARCLVVESPEALRHLTGARPPLVLVPRFDPEELASAAARAGHAVVIPMDETGPIQKDVIPIPPVSRRPVTDALKEFGFDDDRAYQMAGLAVRSLTAFRRSLARSPAFQQPSWSKPGVARGLIPAFLAGSWNAANPRDREVLSRLGRRPYEELVGALLEWSVGSDPLVRRKQDVWYLVSPEDAWRLMGRYLLRPDFERFADAALAVLGSVDPAFDLPSNQRWMAGALDHAPEHSGLLRGGVVKTLLIMGVHGSEVPSPTFSARGMCERVIRELLEAANSDWRLWGSLSDHLSALAEAAPDHFLDAVEEGLREPEPVLGRLFDPDGDTVLGPYLHTGLLRALEVLAWSPDHLGRVVSLLAKLDLLDPESELRLKEGERSRVVHRPLRVLKGIFRSWLPETSATLDERLAVLDGLRESHGSSAWNVMISMLPEPHAVGFSTSRPSFRDWALDAREGVGRSERARTVAEIVVRLLEDSGLSGRRWAEVLGRVDMLPPAEHDLVVGGLEALEVGELDEDDRTAIWTGLRSVVARHRAYRRAKWAMPEEYVTRLDQIRARFAPSDPVARYRCRFGQNPELVDGGDVEDTPWEERERSLENARVEAVVAILQDAGLDGLRALARAVEDPYWVGRSAAGVAMSPSDSDELLSRHLCDPDQTLDRLAFGFARGRVRERGAEWAIRQLQRCELDLALDQRVKMLLALPVGPEAWRAVAECGDDVSLAYWRRIPLQHLFGEKENLSEAVAGLLAAGRPYAAADLAAFVGRVDRQAVTGELAAEVLEQAVATPTEHDLPSPHFGSSAGFLLEVIADAESDQGRLARLEWLLMPVLSWHQRSPDALHQLLADDPEFFVEMLSLVYRAEGTEPEKLDRDAEHSASSAYSVLSSWRVVPGQDSDGRIDGARLQGWLEEAERLLRQAERAGVGHQVIGKMLSGCPHDPDGTWPCKPVREVIEKVASKDLEIGLGTGVVNSRGVVTKDPSAGGASERALAERYEGYAAAVRASHPRTAGALRRIGQSYRQDGSREDFRSEMWEVL